MGRKKRRKQKTKRQASSYPAPNDATEEPENEGDAKGSCLWIFALVAIFLSYFVTLYPGLGPGDSSELQVVGSQLGIAHPPGYPLYTILAFLFSKLPFGNSVWLINLMSAIFSSGAAFLVYLIVHRLTHRPFIGVVSMFAFALSPLVWRYSIVAEVFSLNNLICAAILYVALLFVEKKKEGYFLLFAFLFGLGASNHHLVLFFVFPLFWILILSDFQYFMRASLILRTFLCFLLGLLPYVYLPLRYAQKPKLVWGEFNSWNGFLTHFTRSEYGTVTLDEKTADSAGFFQLIGSYLQQVLHDQFFIGGVLVLFGGYVLWKAIDLRKYRAIILFPLLFYILVFHLLSHMEIGKPLSFGVHSRFWQQPQIIISILFGLGLVWLELYLKPIVKAREAKAIIRSVGLLIIAGFLFRGFIEEDQSNNRITESYGRLILEQTPKNSVLVTQTDWTTNSVRAVQSIYGIREDVVHLDINMMDYEWYGRQVQRKFPELVYPGNKIQRPGHDGFAFSEFYLKNRGRFEIYSAPEIESYLGKDLREDPYGMVSKIVPVTEPIPSVEIVKRHYFDTLASFDFGKSKKFALTHWESVPSIQLQEVKVRVANTIMRNIDGSGDIENLKLVADLLKTAFDNLKAAGNIQLPVAKNYATVLSRLSQKDGSYVNRAIAAYQDYISMADLTPFDQKRFAGFIRDLERRKK